MKINKTFEKLILGVTCLWGSVLFSFSTQAQDLTVPLTDLGQFNLVWGTSQPVQAIKGANRLGQVKFAPGSSLQISFPFAIQQVGFLHQNGAEVNKNQPLATLSGVEVEHFWAAVESSTAVYEAAKEHFEANRSNFRDGTLKNPQWLAMVKNYHQAKLEHEHYHHYADMLVGNESVDIRLKSPSDGYLHINRAYSGDPDEKLIELVPKHALKIEIMLPPSSVNASLLGFTVADTGCQLGIDGIDEQLEGYYQRVWAVAESENCSLLTGQSLLLYPRYRLNGYLIPKQGVFEIDRRSFIAIRERDNVLSVPVNVVGSEGQHLYVTSSKDLSNQQILITSVSALQGIFLGLGGE